MQSSILSENPTLFGDRHQIRNRFNQIPQARPADSSAFHYALEHLLLYRWAAGFAFSISGGPARIAKDPLGSEKPKLPQGKPAGFIVQRNLSGGDYRDVSENPLFSVNRGGEIRTHDLCVPNAALYQAEPRPDSCTWSLDCRTTFLDLQYLRLRSFAFA